MAAQYGKGNMGVSDTGEPGGGTPQPGERVELVVYGLDPRGDGVARTGDGFVIFVEGALPGDRVVASVTHRAPRYARARAVELLDPSTRRVPPPCPVAGECGGCPLMALAYPDQLEAKRALVVEAFRRIGGVEAPEELVRPVLGMAVPWTYRNKGQYPVGRGSDGRPVVGFFQRGTHRIVPAPQCRVQHPLNVRLVAAARDALEELGLEAYDEATGRGWVRHLVARSGEGTGEALLVVVTAGREEPFPGALSELARRVKARVPELAGVVQNVNPSRTNVVLGRENRPVWGDAHLEERVGPLVLRLSATAFFQVNSTQAQLLYAEVRRRIQGFLEGRGLRPPAGTLFDLYCGVGGIGLYAADLVERVVGIEEAPEAVADARENAARNGIANARFLVGTVEELLARQMPTGVGRAAGPGPGAGGGRRGERAGGGCGPMMVVVDPPRKGLEAGVVRTLGAVLPELLVYVSCNPATMARDLGQFLREAQARGVRYEWGPLQPIDMFPHTAHVEVVGHLLRKDARA